MFILAGDHVKFGFPMAAMTTQLAWGAISFQSGYEKAGQLQYMKECLQWATDYFIAAHTSTNEFYGQVGDGNADHGYWGRPEQMTMARPAFKIDASHPGSDLAAETAAALAASSIFYRNIGETAMADNALQHARELYDLADFHRGTYTDHIPAANFYA
jgi:endoglucanase